ncbi:ABC transporter ATP-binding protein [Acidicapsa acidisoli]|uniref:ABC transporter ATP-binding protein n=1 Tax=Acidicapsa acidisoli TaxID=1615681 RepID=UPI0021DF50E9|nr:ABC transporter ATP-binding protein [Acidicapsa acidisoli]
MKESFPTPISYGGSVTFPLPEPGMRQLPHSEDQEPLLRVEGLSKEYPGNSRSGRGALRLFDGLDLEVRRGELVAIVGQSGSGKSTLLHMLGALDTPSAGEIYCATTQVTNLSVREAARFRNEQVGYVWQFHYLLPEFTAQENVAMPLLARGVEKRKAMQDAAAWLAETGLADRAAHRPGELSGGEQQRVALARALVTNPQLLLADEPTGDLDNDSADLVFGLIERLHEAHGLTSVLVTHNLELAGRCTRTLRLAGGRLLEVPRSMSNAEK